VLFIIIFGTLSFLDQLRNDSTRPTGELWRRAVDRGVGHGGATTRRPSPATRQWWRWWWWFRCLLMAGTVHAVAEPDAGGERQNPVCRVDGTCVDPNAQCVRAVCVCKLGFFYRNSVCGQSDIWHCNVKRGDVTWRSLNANVFCLRLVCFFLLFFNVLL